MRWACSVAFGAHEPHFAAIRPLRRIETGDLRVRRRGSALISGLLRGAETSLANAATSLDGLRAGDAPGGPASSEGAWASAIKEGARASESEVTEGGAQAVS
jgi:hypothetical protein